MDYKDITIVLIDDMITDEQAPFNRLKKNYKEIKSFTIPSEGIYFIKQNIENKMIVVLDFQFPSTNGAKVLKEIRKDISYLIPVIILTEKQVTQDEFSELIDYKINYYAVKSSSKDIAEKLKNAAEELNTDVATAIQEWIDFRDSDTRKKPYLIKAETGQEYTLDDILSEVRHQTEFGKNFIKDFYSLTVKLLLLDKERIKSQKA